MPTKIPFEHGIELEAGKDYLLGPPPEILANGLTVQEIEVNESVIPILAVDKDNNPLMEVREGEGLYTMLLGHKYPYRGYIWTDKQGGPLKALGQSKRYLICQIKLFSKFKLIALMIILLGRRKFLDYFLRQYNSFAFPLFESYALTPIMYCTFARELEKLIRNFLANLGFSNEAQGVAETMKHIFQFDDVYRMMLADTFAEVNEQALKDNPYKELCRLVDIATERRNTPKFDENFGAIKKLLFVFRIPYVRNALLKAINEVNLDNLKIDEVDKYHSLYKMGHKYGGKTDPQRLLEWYQLYGGPDKIPPMSKVQIVR